MTCQNRKCRSRDTRTIRTVPGDAPSREHRCNACGARWWSDQRLRAGTLQLSTNSSPAASQQQPDDRPVSVPHPSHSVGGVGVGLPSGSDPDPKSGPISTADQTRARSNNLTSAALCRAFGAIRCEVLGVGLPWQGVRADHAKAADVAERISADPHALQDYQATIRLFFRNAQAGKYDRAADILREPAFAFGAWCSRLTALREELHGKQPAAPLSPEERQRAEARARAKRDADAQVAATDRKLLELRGHGARAAAPPKRVKVVDDAGREFFADDPVAALAEAKGAAHG